MIVEHPTWLMPVTDNGAGIIMMPCPGTKETTIEDTISQLKGQGVTALVSMTTKEEMKGLNADSIPAVCQQNDIQWFNIETVDHKIPGIEALVEWDQCKETLLNVIKQGDKVAIHCKGGTGRSGVGAAMLLLELGKDGDQAIADVKALKPGAFTITSMVEFIKNQAESLTQGA